MKIVCHMRGSTAKQGHSGLGIEAKQAAIQTGIIKRPSTVQCGVKSNQGMNGTLLILFREQTLSDWL